MALPGPSEAVHPDDVAGLERWVSAQQAQLRLLHRQLAAALEASRAARERAAAGGEERRDELERQVRAVVDAQTERLAAAVDSARAEAAARRAQAVHEATVLLIAAGADAGTIQRIVGGEVIDLTGAGAAAPRADAADPQAPGEDEAGDGEQGEPADDDPLAHWADDADDDDDDPDTSAGPPWAGGIGSAGWAPYRGEGPSARAFGAAAGQAALAGGLGDLEASAFNQFWGSVPGEGPGRSRLRRLVEWVEQR